MRSFPCLPCSAFSEPNSRGLLILTLQLSIGAFSAACPMDGTTSSAAALKRCADASRRAGRFAGFHLLARAGRHKLFAGVPGESGHVGEAHQRGLLSALEFGDFALDKEGRELDVEPS